MTPYPHLLAPGRIGGLELSSRVIMSPMATNLANADGTVSEDMIAYYARRARSRPGLITVEMTVIDTPRGNAGTVSLRIGDDDAIPALHKLVDAVDFFDTPVALQIGHAGGNTTVRKTRGVAPIAPSATTFLGGRTLAVEADSATLDQLCVEFGDAAARAKRAGFSAVNLHGGHTYLLAQMLSPLRNLRTDAWGGDLDRRMLFATRVIEQIQAKAGADFPIIYRISADEFLDGGRDLEESKEVAKRLEALGVAMLDVTAGASAPVVDTSAGAEGQWKALRAAIEPMSFAEGWKARLAGEIRSVVSIPVAAVGVIRTPAAAEEILATGVADFVTLGRALIADPDWLTRVRRGSVDRIRPCISCNECSRVRQELDRPIRCAVNPEVGRERIRLTRPEPGGKMIVVGGGAAGLEAARRAALNGWHTEVWEASDQPGGQLIWGAIPPFKHRLESLRRWLVDEARRAGALLRTGTTATVESIVEAAPDAVVVAVGVDPRMPDGPPSLTAYDLLRTGESLPPGPVVVVGGGPTGCEAAMLLAERGHPVRLVTRSLRAGLAQGLENLSRSDVRVTLDELGVAVEESCVCSPVPDGVLISRRQPPAELWTGSVVWAAGVRSKPFDIQRLRDRLPSQATVVNAGDSREPRNILHAVSDGARAAALATAGFGRDDADAV
jgi:2,4-dienoyl-CoA reductase-like NADH-dependent reductase (Old Yellow Enzyme family)